MHLASKTDKTNKLHHATLSIASILTIATIIGIGIYSATNIVNNTNNANALSYSANEDISFTFKPTLSISLSTNNLTIDNLVPGTTSDSNTVTVTVASNTPYGYVLSAGVGSTVSTDPYYNTSDLVHDNSTTQVPTTNKFSSIATSASLQTLDTDNTWGYSTSTDGGTSWSTYSGLSHAETKPLLDISDPAAPSTIDFKIAARSASTQASGTYNNVITFYAVGKPEPGPEDLTFTAGEHIDTLMVADSTQNWKPFYVTSTSTDKSIVFTAPAEGTKYIVTVIPEPGYVLSSDPTYSSYAEDFSTGVLSSKTLLTTTYIAGTEGDNITISVAQAGSDSTYLSYTSMQDLTMAQCPAYTDAAQGINVTDIRNDKSYAVAKFGNYCYMLSNIRVDGGTTLTTTTSHVSSDYTLPADTGSGGWTNNYCQPRMASKNGEYYYNWPAATARTNSTSSTSACYNDASNSVGDICPAGWELPTYNDIAPATIWNGGANPGMISTAGYFWSSQRDVGSSGYLWSRSRSNETRAYVLMADGTSTVRGNSTFKRNGHLVRCRRSS